MITSPAMTPNPMSRLLWICAAALIAVACEKKSTKPATPPATAADAAPAVDASPPDAPEPPDAAPAPAAGFPSLESEDSVLVLAEKAGDKVIGKREDGSNVEIADGTVTKAAEGWKGIAANHDVIDVGGKGASVSTDRLVDLLRVSPRGDYAIAIPRVGDECEEACFAEMWLLHGMTERWKVVDGTSITQVGWEPGGKEVTVTTSDGVAIVELPSAKVVKTLKGYTSPSYSPDGVLYLRGLENWHYFEYRDGKPKRIAKGKPVASDDEEGGEAHPEPIEFGPDGKPVIPKG